MEPTTFAKLIAVPTSFILSGYGIAASHSSIPAIIEQSPKVQLVAFHHIFYRGGNLVVPGSIIAAAASGYLAYAITKQRIFWASAGGSILAVSPFTRLVMWSAISRLLEIGKSTVETEKAWQSGEILRLLKTWSAQNYMRASLSFTAGVLGLWAVVTEGW